MIYEEFVLNGQPILNWIEFMENVSIGSELAFLDLLIDGFAMVMGVVGLEYCQFLVFEFHCLGC